MSSAILYTALSVVNLVAFLVGIVFLPERAPVHFDAHGLVDGFSSSWSYAAFPAAAALLSLGVWVVALKKKRSVLIIAIFGALGTALAAIGWVFFGFAAQNLELGERPAFPYPAVTVFPLSVLLIAAGFCLPRFGQYVKRPYQTLSDAYLGVLFGRFGKLFCMAAGAVSALGAILFSCLDAALRFDYLSIVLFAVSLIALAVACSIAARRCLKEKP